MAIEKQPVSIISNPSEEIELEINSMQKHA